MWQCFICSLKNQEIWNFIYYWQLCVKYISFKTIQTEKYILVTMLNIIWDSKVFISWVILKLIMCIFYTRPELYTFKYRIQRRKKKEHKSAYFCVFILIFWTQTIIFITFYIWFYFLNGFPLKMTLILAFTSLYVGKDSHQI